MISNVTECKHDPQYPDPWDMAPGIQTLGVRAGQSHETQQKGGNIWKKKLFKCSLKLLRIYLFIYPDMCTRRIPLITD